MILGIDPGISTGWATFTRQGVFLDAGVGSFPIAGVAHAVIERPQVYRASASKGDPNDLITLAIRVGQYQERLEARGVKVTLVLPTTWKGQIPKAIHHARILANIPDAEKVRLLAASARVASGQRPDMLDAVGLGQWLFRSGKV